MILGDGKELHMWDSCKDWLFLGGRWIWGLLACFWGVLTPLHTIIFCACIAIGIDFLTGNVASFFVSRRKGERYRLNSDKMWKTVWKLALTVIGTGFAWMLDFYVFPVSIGASHILASFILGAEFCSFLENASTITGWTGFVNSKKILKDSFQSKTNLKLPENDNEVFHNCGNDSDKSTI